MALLRPTGRRRAVDARLRLGHRPDIEGLRAVAVALVVVYHAGIGLFPGGYVGVDVFFVLSGFLITRLLVDELARSGRVSFTNFYGRRMRRLLPASTLTLVVTVLVFTVVLSPLDRPAMVDDVRAAALYFANWHFAANSLDYLTGNRTSPVLHFWSLAVEEQFYLVWPLLLVLATRRVVRRGDTAAVRRASIVALGSVAAVSLVLSTVVTRTDAPFAYYGLHTRAWELAAGGLLALAPASFADLPRVARVLAGWLGTGFIVVSAVRFGDRTAFPGTAALVPVVGTLLVVGSGAGGQRSGVPLLLSAAPLRYVGRISYSWYLWHWPALVLAGVLTSRSVAGDGAGGTATLGTMPMLLAVAGSFAVAALAHHVVEDPLRRSRWIASVRRRSLQLGAASTATALSVSVAAVAVAGTGAASGATTIRSVTVQLRMSPWQAREDRPHGDERCYAGYQSASAPSAAQCLFGDRTASRAVVLLGDSHAQQWFTAIDTEAKRYHWRLYVWVKSECPFTDVDLWLPQFHGRYPTCRPWRARVLQHLRSIGHIDAVILANTSTYQWHLLRADGSATKPGGQEALGLWGQGYARMVSTLRPFVSHVVVIRDPPRPNIDVPACLASHPKDATPCTFPRSFAFSWADPMLHAQLAAGLSPKDVIDLSPQMCPGNPCPVVTNDGLIMFRDSNHLTTAYTMTLADSLGRRLAAAMS